ncbi:MAG TPA: hypothetical protein PK736_06105 [Bacteroidia bacterium]|nr:hypothetical protein [Bacteroidia bacterium]
MTNTNDIFFDKELRTGGFYELAIQVCKSADNIPIRLYSDFFWTQKNVEGPFDSNKTSIVFDIKNSNHHGILHLDNFTIPFKTYNIREEEPIETGFYWFDICFYTTTIEKVFSLTQQDWTDYPSVPNELKKFFMTTLAKLDKIFPLQLAILDFEASGQFYLEDLKTPLTFIYNPPCFFVGQDNYEHISIENRKYVTKIEDITNE